MELLFTISGNLFDLTRDTLQQIPVDTGAKSIIQSVSASDVITKITYLLFLFLILAIFIERATEIFMSFVKYLDIKADWYKFWNNQAERLRRRLDRLFNFQGSGAEDKKQLYKWILWKIMTEKPYTGGKDIIAAISVRTQYYRIISRIFAFMLSLFFAIWTFCHLKVDLVTILNKISDIKLIGVLAPWIKILLTAAILTVGAEPMHQLIKRFERIGESKKNKK